MDTRMNGHESDVVQLRPASAPANDQLDTAGQTILQMIDRAAGVAEEHSRHALEMAQKLSYDLPAAEDRVAELEAEVAELGFVDCTVIQPFVDASLCGCYRSALESS